MKTRTRKTLVVATTSYAGMGPYVTEIVNEFSPKEEIYFFFLDYEDDFFKKNIKEELHKHSFFFKRANTKLNKLKNLLMFDNAIQKKIFEFCLEKKIELVHFINGPAPINILKRLNKNGIFVISTIHDLHPHEYKKIWYKNIRFKIFYIQLRNSFLKGKFFITNSISQFNEIQTSYPEKKVFFHPFPSLVSNSVASGCKVAKEIQHIKNPYILFFGRIESYKGVSLLYETFTHSKELYENFSLVIAGSGSLYFERTKNEKNVIFLNRYIEDCEVAELYRNAKAIVYPYISATQSGVLSLAFYYGIPVITSDVPFFKEIMKDISSDLCFKTGSSDDLKDKLTTLLRKDSTSISQKEKSYYKKYYDKKKIHDDLISIYNSLSPI